MYCLESGSGPVGVTCCEELRSSHTQLRLLAEVAERQTHQLEGLEIAFSNDFSNNFKTNN